jgi:hypothetical protein
MSNQTNGTVAQVETNGAAVKAKGKKVQTATDWLGENGFAHKWVGSTAGLKYALKGHLGKTTDKALAALAAAQADPVKVAAAKLETESGKSEGKNTAKVFGADLSAFITAAAKGEVVADEE